MRPCFALLAACILSACSSSPGSTGASSDDLANASHDAGVADSACTPRTCAELGRQCGTQSDGCGNTLQCGACTAGQTCVGAGQCETAGACGGASTTCGPSSYTATACGPSGGASCTNDTYTNNLAPPAEDTYLCDTDFPHSSQGGLDPSCPGTTFFRCTGPKFAAAYAAATGGSVDDSFHGASGAPESVFSIDKTQVAFTSSKGNASIIADLDLSAPSCTFREMPSGIGAGSSQLHYSLTEPKILYGYAANQPVLGQLDEHTVPGVVSTLVTLNSVCDFKDGSGNPTTLTGTGGGWTTSIDMTGSGHDTYYASYIGPQNTAAWAVAVARLGQDGATPGCQWYNVASDRMGGHNWPGVASDAALSCTNCLGQVGIGLHAVELSLNGAFLQLADTVCVPSCTPPGTPWVVVWQLGTTTIAQSTVMDASGHRGWGYDHEFNGPSGGNVQWNGVIGSAPNTKLQYGLRLGGTVDQHNTFETANATDDNVMFTDSYVYIAEKGQCQDSTVPGLNEIMGVKMAEQQGTAAQAPTYRFMHNHANACLDSSDFWSVPVGTVSRDGTAYLFASNWDGQLGSEATSGFHRKDIFVMEAR